VGGRRRFVRAAGRWRRNASAPSFQSFSFSSLGQSTVVGVVLMRVRKAVAVPRFQRGRRSGARTPIRGICEARCSGWNGVRNRLPFDEGKGSPEICPLLQRGNRERGAVRREVGRWLARQLEGSRGRRQGDPMGKKSIVLSVSLLRRRRVGVGVGRRASSRRRPALPAARRSACA